MPQLTQLPDVFWSQLFWLAVVFGILFFVIGRGMVPKIQATVDAREEQIAKDLEAAQGARVAADETEAAYRARMDASRAEAARLTQEAKQASALETEAQVRAAADQINAKVEAAEAQIRDARDAARAEIEAVAVDATQEIVSRVAGLQIGRDHAVQAVKAELNV